jgi:hypothetical protein
MSSAHPGPKLSPLVTHIEKDKKIHGAVEKKKNGKALH